jgi:hypothetical protein
VSVPLEDDLESVVAVAETGDLGISEDADALPVALIVCLVLLIVELCGWLLVLDSDLWEEDRMLDRWPDSDV